MPKTDFQKHIHVSLRLTYQNTSQKKQWKDYFCLQLDTAAILLIPDLIPINLSDFLIQLKFNQIIIVTVITSQNNKDVVSFEL